MRFTFVTEKAGSTIIEQVDAGDVDVALRKWYEESSTLPVGLLDAQDPYYDPPTPIEGLEGVWGHGCHDTDEVFILTHIVATMMPEDTQVNHRQSARSATKGTAPMAHYTIIMDWDGGTYLRQVRAESGRQAILCWAEKLDVGPIPRMGPAARGQLVEELREDEGAGITGLVNVWRFSARVRGRLALIHMVRTEEPAGDGAPSETLGAAAP